MRHGIGRPTTLYVVHYQCSDGHKRYERLANPRVTYTYGRSGGAGKSSFCSSLASTVLQAISGAPMHSIPQRSSSGARLRATPRLRVTPRLRKVSRDRRSAMRLCGPVHRVSIGSVGIGSYLMLACHHIIDHVQITIIRNSQ